MGIEEEISALRRAPLFKGVDPGRLRLLAITADFVRFKAGERIYTVGEKSDDVLFILSGQVRSEGGADLQMLVGHIGTLLQRPRMTSIYAVSDVEALRLGRDNFVNLLQTCDQIALAVILELSRVLDKLINPISAMEMA
jgi:CRP-like cAMP-binding protein